ncbi:MAG: hypothetical protein E4H01_08120 [Lysobacterales bacterium]|nr:MAG: hypothetical protein E4H01_08120 [Xanthomonadales bacterium]
MNIEMSPRIRTVVSGLAAVATTALLMSTLVESLDPRRLQSGGELSAPVAAATVDIHKNAALIRRV